MISTVVRVRVEEDGTVRIPPDVWQELGVEPYQGLEVLVNIQPISLPPEPIAMTQDDQLRMDRIIDLLEQSFETVDTDEAWTEIHEARRDRWL